jgi:hypothetical protein
VGLHRESPDRKVRTPWSRVVKRVGDIVGDIKRVGDIDMVEHQEWDIVGIKSVGYCGGHHDPEWGTPWSHRRSTSRAGDIKAQHHALVPNSSCTIKYPLLSSTSAIEAINLDADHLKYTEEAWMETSFETRNNRKESTGKNSI